MGRTPQKPRTRNTAQDVAGADQRIAAHLRELAERRAALDRDLVTAALHKRAARAAPTVREATALGKFERINAEQQWWQTCRRLPQQYLRVLSGRQTKQINEQAERYRLPIGGKTWDLAGLVLELFALLAEIAPWYGQWQEGNGDQALLGGPSTPALERFRLARAKLGELDLAERTREVLPRAEVRDEFTKLAGFLREAGQRIAREHGPAAAKILDDALEQFPRLMQRLLRPGEKLEAARVGK